MEPSTNDSNQTPDALEAHRIPSMPSSFYYIPNFLTPTESSALLQKIPTNRWTHLQHRRLQAHPSPLLARSNALLCAPLPPWLGSAAPVLARLARLHAFRGAPHAAPNHCLVNEYRAGEGIMRHEDGPAYAAVVATVSLGGVVVLDVVEKEGVGKGSEGEEGDGRGARRGGRRWRVLLEPGSLLITRGEEGYAGCLHGIDGVERDEDLREETVANWGLLASREEFEGGFSVRQTRVSLTYRDVLKVVKVPGLAGLIKH